MPTLFLVHNDCLSVAVEAANLINLPLTRIIVIDAHDEAIPYRSCHDLVNEGRQLPAFVDKPLREGEAKEKIAFLAPSSGTTGVQKVRSSSNPIFNACRSNHRLWLSVTTM